MPRPKLRGSAHKINGLIRACLYLRMSSDKQDTSIDIQRAALRKYAQAHGYEIVCEFVDQAISGNHTDDRLEFKRMIALAGEGRWQVILCLNQDRFGRFPPHEASYWTWPLAQAGIQLVTADKGAIDWNDFVQWLTYSVNQQGKHEFLHDLADHTMGGMLRAAQEGKPLGPPPRGYKLVEFGEKDRKGRRQKKVEIDEPEAEVIRLIFRLCLEGWSCRRIACELDRRGIPPSYRRNRGARWHMKRVAEILANEYYTGVYTWNEESRAEYREIVNSVVVPVIGPRRSLHKKQMTDVFRRENHHPAIVTREAFILAQEALTKRRKGTSPARGDEAYAFSGLLWCGQCGAKMYGRSVKGRKFYKCSGSQHQHDCQANTVREDELLPLVMGGIIKHLQDKHEMAKLDRQIEQEISRLAKQDDTRSLQTQLTIVQAKIQNLKDKLELCTGAVSFAALEERLNLQCALEQTLLADIKRLQAAGRLTLDDHHARVRRVQREVERLASQNSGDDPEALQRDLADIITRVDVYVDAVQRDPAHRVYTLNRLDIDWPMGDLLTLTPDRTHDTYASAYVSCTRSGNIQVSRITVFADGRMSAATSRELTRSI